MRERLKKARKALGLSQTEFAEKLGLTQPAIGFLEQGKTPITEKHIKPICAIFGINELWLTQGVGDMFIKRDEIDEFLDIYKKLNPRNREYMDSLLLAMLKTQDDLEASEKSTDNTITAEDGEDLISEPAVYEDYLEGGEKS